MSSKPSKGKQQNMSLKDAKQKYNLGEIFDEIDSLVSRETSRNTAVEIGNRLKRIIINYNRQLEIGEHIMESEKAVHECYDKLIDDQEKLTEYWEGLSERQKDVIDSQQKLITVLEEKDEYITENYDITDDFNDEPDGDEGDEKE